jgi:hypothetical protein
MASIELKEVEEVVKLIEVVVEVAEDAYPLPEDYEYILENTN